MAEQRLGVTLPAALRNFYLRYGSRREVWSLQDTLWMPNEIRVERGVLAFCIENQGVVRWGIRLDDLRTDDPPVVVSDPEGRSEWLTECTTLSGFALQFALLNVKWSDTVRYRANGQGKDEAFDAIETSYTRIPVPDLHWPANPTRFYGNDHVIIETEASTWIWASARTQAALDELSATVEANTDSWEIG